MSDLNVGIVGLGWVAGAHIETFKSGGRGPTSPRSAPAGNRTRPTWKRSSAPRLRRIPATRRCSPTRHRRRRHLHPPPLPRAAGDRRGARRQAPDHREADLLTYGDMVAMGEAIGESGVQVCVCFECRYSAHFTLIRSVIDQGLLGELHYGEVDYYHGIGPWYGQYGWNVKKEMGGSSLLTAGCHAHRRLPVLHGRKRRGGVELPGDVQGDGFRAVRVQHHQRQHPEVFPAAKSSPRSPPASTACSPTTSTSTWSAARAACSTTGSTRRSSRGWSRTGGAPSRLR